MPVCLELTDNVRLSRVHLRRLLRLLILPVLDALILAQTGKILQPRRFTTQIRAPALEDRAALNSHPVVLGIPFLDQAIPDQIIREPLQVIPAHDHPP